MNIISNNTELERVCSKLSVEKIIAVDTEFMRRSSYFAHICLIQIVSPSYQLIIDPLSENLDLLPINDLLSNDKIIKIFHAARQDIEIFYNLFKQVPKNIFDTQLASELIGDGKNLSYRNLCEKYLDIKIDKTYQEANWLMRPLTDKMLNYALLDTVYLLDLYEKLSSVIKQKHLQLELSALHNTLLSLSNYTSAAQNAWQKVKFLNRSETFIERMQIIASYREECAKLEDIPRLHFASDEDLIKICNALPVDDIELSKLRLSKSLFNKPKYKHHLFELCLALQENDV